MNMQIEVFDPIKAEIEKIRAHNAGLSFDYESPEGNKAARSHIFTMRKVKTRIADAHKEAKADALRVCQVIDSLKRDLTKEVDDMIEIHAKPIREIEERDARIAEEKRLAEERAKAEDEARRIAEIEKREAEARAKEEELRSKQAEIERREREARIAQEARERAEREAQERIAFERAEAERRHREAMEAERAKIEAEKRAEAERIRIAKEEEAKRIADKEHRELVESEAMSDMLKYETLNGLLTAIVEGKIRHISIQY